MNFSGPFILRPVGTALLALGLFLAGAVAYGFLPVSSMPTVEFPTIRVSASRPGADPSIMASTVAAPLERRLGEIPGVTEITSSSSLGSTSITIQFDLDRGIDSAARDVQAALNAALTDLPGDLPTLPTMRKVNPSAAPVLILALTSNTMLASNLYDVADSVIAQRIAQVEGPGPRAGATPSAGRAAEGGRNRGRLGADRALGGGRGRSAGRWRGRRGPLAATTGQIDEYRRRESPWERQAWSL